MDRSAIIKTLKDRKVSLSYAAGFYTKTFEEFIGNAADLGFAGVQLIPDQHPNLYSEFDERRIDAVRSLLKSKRVYASVHNVFYDINPTSLIPDVQNYSLEISSQVMELAKALGAQAITVHPGYAYPGWVSDAKQRARYLDSARVGIAKLAELASSFDLSLLFENGSYRLTALKSDRSTPFHFGIEISELREVLNYCDGKAQICFDISKALASNISLNEFVSEFGDVIRQVQFSNLAHVGEVLTVAGKRRLPIDEVDFVYEGRDKSVLQSFTKRPKE